MALAGVAAASVSQLDFTLKSQTICCLQRNDMFGEVGVVNRVPRTASIIAREPIELLAFDDLVQFCPILFIVFT